MRAKTITIVIIEAGSIMNNDNQAYQPYKLNRIIEQEKKEWKSLSGRKRTHEVHNGTELLSIETRRQIIIGGIVSDVFPEVMYYEPKNDEVSNNAEFAQIKCFLSLLAADDKYVMQLKEQVNQKLNLSFHNV